MHDIFGPSVPFAEYILSLINDAKVYQFIICECIFINIYRLRVF